MEILKYPNEALRAECKSVELVTPAMVEQFEEMLELMYKHKGCGLAAPQVGILLRVLVMNHTGTKWSKGNEYIFLNPVITNMFGGTSVRPEGCLSMPGMSVNVRRPKRVKFEAWTLKGKLMTGAFSGMQARVLQHEVDHLDGKLIIDNEAQ